MKTACAVMLAVFSFSAAVPAAASGPPPPQVLFEDLYSDVELQRIFPDSKEFADATAKLSPAEILARYHAQKPNSSEGLKRFVAANFDLPADPVTPIQTLEHGSLREHIDALWGRLTRNTPTAAPYASLLPLPKPYVVPGGRFREIYYWDSYFTMLGLAESGRRDLLRTWSRLCVHDRRLWARAERRSLLLLDPFATAVFLRHGRLISPTDPAAASLAIYLGWSANMRSGWRAKRLWPRAKRIVASLRSRTARY